MLWPERALPRLECPPVERLGFVVPALRLVEAAEAVYADERFGVLRPERALPRLERTQV